MLRDLRVSDLPAYAELYRQHFPDEARLLLTDADAFARIVARAFRWDARLVLGLLRLLGRPIGDFLAVDVDGALAGVTFVFYDPPAGHFASVVVGTPYRRRGFARRLVLEAERRARRHRCRHAVLEVIEGNGPALALYRSMGYSPLRDLAWHYRDVGAPSPPLPDPGAGPETDDVRPFQRSDAPALLAIATERQSEAERSVRPYRHSSFRVAPPVIQALGGETAAFVRAGPDDARAFVRCSTSGAMASAHLSGVIAAPEVTDAEALALLDRALGWFRGRPVRRILCEAADADERLLRWLAARGFQRGLGFHALTKPL